MGFDEDVAFPRALCIINGYVSCLCSIWYLFIEGHYYRNMEVGCSCSL